MRQALYKASQNLVLAQSQKHYIETEHSAAQRIYNLKTDKKVEFVEDFVYDPKVPKVNEETMNDANAFLIQPLNFYGSYLQLSGYKKLDVLQNATVKKLSQIIAQMRVDRQRMIDDQEAIQNVARMNFDLAQRDADRIKLLDHEIKVEIKKNKL